ncbi:hypothetical protein CHLRE_14g624650v5 [Chlamydomonas reinhardtii]|uniref:N-acetyltransferase domain-containing protein n=1 Tax=Chlamydomonas reinhardtii TaxID=3055 RepID=A0A2K3CY78_CHLRE|nr:uncharacterized protein CHLRE_14g624650v5 [Chlamydomonas reinhardtii]PNW73244.1 hypothetical protein CHLRE_14g624650v5 [Chlamydomonas reinhardtii]
MVATSGASAPVVVGSAVAVAEALATTTLAHTVRPFDYARDIEDLREICAKVYDGTDYMPRLVKKLSEDPGVLVLAAEAVGSPEGETADSSGGGAGRIDGIICGERRGECIWLFGLRVREGIRGKGMGHFLMEAICTRAPVELRCNAHPPGVAPPEFGPLPPPASPALTVSNSSSPSDACHAAATPEPITSIVTCTTSYNPAAQRIIGRQLTGPLYEVEGWPSHKPLDEYEAAAGWVRGRGVPAGAPNMIDWIPGARQALESDVAAQALLPRWRRVSGVAELRSAVSHLLYGTTASSSSSSGGAGGRDPAKGAASSCRALEPLLWLPMPYDAFPITGPFVARELAAGNVWLLTAPAPGSGGAGAEGKQEHHQEEEVVGVMLLTYFEMLNRISAGILARDNAATHAAILHAGRLHPHFMAFTLRAAATAPPPTQQHTAQLHGGGSSAAPTGAGAAGAGAAGAGAGPGSEDGGGGVPLPALYTATGGYRDHWVYGKRV